MKSGCPLLMVAVLVFAALAVDAVSVADEIKALNETIASNSVSRSVRSRYYLAWFRELCTKEEREAILERNVAAHRRLIEIRPNDTALRADLGVVLSLGGRYKEAESVLNEAIANGTLDQGQASEARWALAECLWRRGDKDGAKKIVADIATMPWKGDAPRSSARDKATFLHLAWTDPDADIDHFGLPHSVDGKPFPVPQEAKYGEKKVSLARVEIRFRTNGTSGTDGTSPASLISPVSPETPIVRLLKRKLSRIGATFAPSGTPIEIELSQNAPVDKPQGYSLDVAEDKVVVKARTRLGLTWGVVSLLQCIEKRDERDGSDKRDGPSICEMAIRDWPKLEKRGVIAHWNPWHLEYELFNKMSSIAMDMFRPQWSFLASPLEREVARLSIKRRNDFGIDLRWANRWIIVDPNLPLSSPRVRAMHLAWMRCAASYGAGVWFDEDDSRYPMRPEDIAAFGTSDKLDAKYLTELYREVKAEFPEFRLTFGPPFYFGPDAAATGSWYPEPRLPYLKSLGEFLDPEIDVYWSGPRVKSYGFTPEKIAWFSNLVGRAQVIYHNADCAMAHNNFSYGVDVPRYKQVHCPETMDLIGGFYQNTSRYETANQVGPAMDWCWNPEAHDDAESCRREIEMLEGPDVFEIIAEGTKSLSCFDKYSRGHPRGELFLEDPDDLDSRVAAAEKAWAEASAIGKNKARFLRGFENPGIMWAKKLAGYRRNPPEWLVRQRDAEMHNTKFAVEEVGYDESKGDQFIPAEMMQGGWFFSGNTRGVKYVTPGKEVAMNFNCDNFPPDRPPTVIICGLGHPVEMEVTVNGNVIKNEKLMFDNRRFTPVEIEVPVVALQRSNRLVVKNVSHEDRRPQISYVVVRK